MYSSQAFHKSSYSANEAACVEVAEGRSVLVRDTQNREAGALRFPPTEWQALIGSTQDEA
ncbi:MULTISPECIES: DUF397 domain-containing protein [Nocardiopsis]|uniref:DUF397 domain-containing protein n=1 Tax=Nocardiopsis TaxID=2013 RepID=UPI0009FE6C63|nr:MULTISPECIES: DUF397 domain-containing protein [Nocardiopsis]PWV52212.1 uncharacterized protein DUF397 [Nocardiopsis sp. L17-MgMaSL7]